MNEPRSLVVPSVDLDRTQQRGVLNRCLLMAALIIAGLAGADTLNSASSSRVPEIRNLAALGSSLLWLLLTYLIGRSGRLPLASGMLVTLMLGSFGLALALVPDQAPMLLPLAALPVALAALLLPRPVAYLIALVTSLIVAALLAAPLLQGDRPIPPTLLPLPTWLALAAVLTSTLLLVLLLGAPRRAIAALTEQLAHQTSARQQAEHAQRTAQAAHDIARQQLGRQTRQHEAMVAQISDGAIAVGSAGHVVRASPTAQAIWASLHSAPLLGQPLATVQHIFDAPSSGIALVALDGPTTQEDGYTHLLHDQRDQARFQRLRDELLGLLADEMRNPLTSVVTALDLTMGEQNLPEDLDRVLLGARRSGQRLLDLVNVIIEIDQIGRDPQVLRRLPTSVCRVLDASVAQIAPLAQQGAVTVVVEYTADSTVPLDGERLQRAFVYLLEHALRHSPPYSTLHVRTERQADTALIRISDQGPGLTPQQREALFDWRTGAQARGGPVLGLAFGKVLIAAHGGQLTIESNTSGPGACYLVALPFDTQIPQLDLALQAANRTT